jgi:hypothetical protein
MISLAEQIYTILDHNRNHSSIILLSTFLAICANFKYIYIYIYTFSIDVAMFHIYFSLTIR